MSVFGAVNRGDTDLEVPVESVRDRRSKKYWSAFGWKQIRGDNTVCLNDCVTDKSSFNLVTTITYMCCLYGCITNHALAFGNPKYGDIFGSTITFGGACTLSLCISLADTVSTEFSRHACKFSCSCLTREGKKLI